MPRMDRCIRLAFDASAAATEGKPTNFAGVAYSGGLIPSWNAVVDLATTRVADKPHVLLQHRSDKVIGTIDAHEKGDALSVTGRIYSDIDQDAAAVVAKAGRGTSYQMSIGLYHAAEKFVPAGSKVTVNGREFSGPLVVLSDGLIREASVVALGADPNTNARFFSEGHSFSPTGATEMPQSLEQAMTANAELTAQNAALTAQVAELTQQIGAMREASAKAEREARLAAVRSLFEDTGREFSDEAATPYLAMSGDAFAAVAADLRAVVKRVPEELTKHQAAEGPQQGSGSKSVLVADAERRAQAAR